MADSTSSLFDAALARLRRHRLLETAALGGSVLLTLPALPACTDAAETSEQEQADWAQYEGKRDTSMVSYTGAWSSNCAGENTRFGCGSIAAHLKVRVKPVQGADLAWKRVGVVYKSPNDPTERTAVGSYSHTYANGDEEWNVTVTTPSWKSTIVFDTWYQTGTGQTFVDDNEGELHVINAGPDYNIIRVEPWLNTVAVGASGVHGKISVQVSDLDFDKQLELHATTDGWQTVHQLGVGAQGEPNKMYWTEDFPFAEGRERWQIDLDLPGDAQQLEYAVVYRHGVVNNAKRYEWWDNNGGSNYRVDRTVTP